MAKIPIQYSERLPAVVQQPRADTGAAMIGEALARAGGVLHQIGADQRDRMRRAEAEAHKNQVYAETQNGKIALSEFDSETKLMLRDITDVEKIAEIGQKRISERSRLFENIATTPESREALDFYTRQTAVGMVEHIEAAHYDRAHQDAWVAFDSVFDMAAQAGNFGILGSLAQQAYNNNIIGDKEFRRYMDSIPKLQEQYFSEQAYSLAYDILRANGPMSDAREAIKAGLPSDQWQGAFNDLERFGKQMDSERATQFQQIQNETDAVFYEQLMSGELTPEKVRQVAETEGQAVVWDMLLGNVDTESSVGAQVSRMRIFSGLRQNDIDRQTALRQLAEIPNLSRGDTIDAVDQIFKLADEAATPDKVTRNKIFETYVSRLRGRIERRTSPLDVFDENVEMLRQIADDAELEFRRQFAEGQWDYDDLERASREVLQRFPTDDRTIRNRIDHRSITQIENRDDQREYVFNEIRKRRDEGDVSGARDLAQQALEIGVISRSELDGERETEPDAEPVSRWRRIWDAMR